MGGAAMGKVVGYMATWATYGSWLQGDERGYVRKGKVLGGSEGLERANKRMLKGTVVKLNKTERESIKKAILAEAERIGERLLAVSVQSSHVHVVIAAGGKPIGKVVSRLKCAGYYDGWRKGPGRRLWARGYDKRLCFEEESLVNRVRYVERHKG
jgi:hypothetical protein